MDAILVHGMGRTPLGMSILAARLRASAIRPHLFAYSVTFEHWDHCINRLEDFISMKAGAKEYILIGHSLGTVLIRAVLPGLFSTPAACFFLAPPVQVCKSVRVFGQNRLAKLIGGDYVRLLASDPFLRSLPVASVPTKIYAGTGGPRGWYSLFGEEFNDGVLTVQETSLPGIPIKTVPFLHPFIMNSKIVAQDIVKTARSCSRAGI